VNEKKKVMKKQRRSKKKVLREKLFFIVRVGICKSGLHFIMGDRRSISKMSEVENFWQVHGFTDRKMIRTHSECLQTTIVTVKGKL
jgi:hypothetical protein